MYYIKLSISGRTNFLFLKIYILTLKLKSCNVCIIMQWYYMIYMCISLLLNHNTLENGECASFILKEFVCNIPLHSYPAYSSRYTKSPCRAELWTRNRLLVISLLTTYKSSSLSILQLKPALHLSQPITTPLQTMCWHLYWLTWTLLSFQSTTNTTHCWNIDQVYLYYKDTWSMFQQ